jgi:hypothetical protein
MPSAPAPALVVAEATPSNSEDNIVAAAAAVDNPTTAPSSAAPDTPPLDASQAPVMASSLAALKGSDALERRASKRFSSYNISKITGGGIRERLGFGRGTNRRSMAVDSSNLTPTDLNVLTEEDETGAWTTVTRAESGTKSRGANGSLSRKVSNNEPPVPPVPKDVARFASPIPEKTASTFQSTSSPPEEADEPSNATTFTIFLQVGREVKKAQIEPGQSFSSLRVLFMDKFSYNPGQDNFPSIYIRDPSSGVMYELEDVEEVKDKCLLSLNIEREYCSQT